MDGGQLGFAPDPCENAPSASLLGKVWLYLKGAILEFLFLFFEGFIYLFI